MLIEFLLTMLLSSFFVLVTWFISSFSTVTYIIFPTVSLMLLYIFVLHTVILAFLTNLSPGFLNSHNFLSFFVVLLYFSIAMSCDVVDD